MLCGVRNPHGPVRMGGLVIVGNILKFDLFFRRWSVSSVGLERLVTFTSIKLTFLLILISGANSIC